MQTTISRNRPSDGTGRVNPRPLNLPGLAKADLEAPSALAGSIDFELPELADLVASTLGEPLVGAGGIVEDVALGRSASASRGRSAEVLL